MATFSTAALNAGADFYADKTYEVRLHTAAPGSNGANEVNTSIGYARDSLTAADYGSATSGRADATGTMAFGTVTQAVSIAYATFWVSGALWITHQFSSPISVALGATITVPVSNMPDFLIRNN